MHLCSHVLPGFLFKRNAVVSATENYQCELTICVQHNLAGTRTTGL